MPACSCQPNFVGRPPNCRPECIINAECPRDKACQKERCLDPCPGSCGINARCLTINHAPVCTCITGFSGDPFSGCTPAQSKGNFISWCTYASAFAQFDLVE